MKSFPQSNRCRSTDRKHHWVVASSLLVFLPFLAGCVSRSESDVVVYSALDEEFSSPILQAFERSNDEQTTVIAKFDVESTKTVGLVNQIIAEQKRPNCDVFWNNEIMHTVRLQKLGLLEPRDWAISPGHPPDLIASDGTWCGFAARARVLVVNTELVSDPQSYPQSVAELADEKWAGNCAMARPLFGTTATHFAVLREVEGEAATLDFLNKIQDNAIVLSGNKQGRPCRLIRAGCLGPDRYGRRDRRKGEWNAGSNCLSRSIAWAVGDAAYPQHRRGDSRGATPGRSWSSCRLLDPTEDRRAACDGRKQPATRQPRERLPAASTAQDSRALDASRF